MCADRYNLPELGLIEPGQSKTRFELLEKDIYVVGDSIQNGATLTAFATDGRIQVQVGEVFGTFPAFWTGVCSIGYALQIGTRVENHSGTCQGLTDLDKLLLEGQRLTIERLGPAFLATLSRSLPPRSFHFKGKEHWIYRKELRKAKANTYPKALFNVLQAAPEIFEGSILRE